MSSSSICEGDVFPDSSSYSLVIWGSSSLSDELDPEFDSVKDCWFTSSLGSLDKKYSLPWGNSKLA